MKIPARITSGLSAASLIIALASFLACDEAGSNYTVSPAWNVIPPGSNAVVEETRPVSGVNGVVLAGVGQVFVRQGGVESLRVRTEERIMPFISTEMQGGRLVLGFDAGTGYQGQSSAIEFHLTVVNLENLELRGTGRISVSNLDGNRLSAVQTGVGGISVTGRVQQQSVVVDGLGDYDARHLDAAVADVATLGGGSATVRVSDRLDVRIDGSGSVYYYGDPVVQRTGHGSGSVQRSGG